MLRQCYPLPRSFRRSAQHCPPLSRYLYVTIDIDVPWTIFAGRPVAVPLRLSVVLETRRSTVSIRSDCPFLLMPALQVLSMGIRLRFHSQSRTSPLPVIPLLHFFIFKASACPCPYSNYKVYILHTGSGMGVSA